MGRQVRESGRTVRNTAQGNFQAAKEAFVTPRVSKQPRWGAGGVAVASFVCSFLSQRSDDKDHIWPCSLGPLVPQNRPR